MAATGAGVLVAVAREADFRAVEEALRGIGPRPIRTNSVEDARTAAAALATAVLDLNGIGLELASAIRSATAGRAVPLLFLAPPDTPQELLTRAYAFDPADCLGAPPDPAALRSRLKIVLELRWRAELLRASPEATAAVAAAAREGEARVTALGDHLPNGMIYQVVQGPEGGRQFSYISAGVEALLGVPPTEVLADARALYSLILPEDLPGVIRTEIAALEAKAPFEFEFRQRTRAGEVKWIRCRSAPREVNGTIVWDGIALDVTAERRTADERRASDERFRLMADHAPVMIWIAGPDKKCSWFNKPWLDFVGRDLAQEIGDGWSESVYPDDLRACVETYTSAFDSRRPIVNEYRLRRRDGAYRWVLDHGVPLYGPDAQFAGYIGSAVDITDRKEMEVALREADRRKEDYLIMLAHELRNPLAPIRTGLHLLGRRPNDQRLVGDVRAMMSRQVEHMSRIVDDLLDVSRIATGKVTLRPTRLDLADVVRTCVDDRRPVAEGAGLRLSLDTSGGAVWVDGDAVRLSQVFDNLIQNAVKFTPRGGSIALSVAAEGALAVVHCRDTGTGIEPEMLPRLFDIFSQADRSLDRSKGGLGLGLALVKGLVELHAGAVEARSEGAGTGAEFTVRLPLSSEPAALSGFSKPGAGAASRKCVLIVEDNRDSAESMRLLLSLSGHDVAVAHTGADAVGMAERIAPDAVVCDIGLPSMDGYTVAAALRPAAGKGPRLIAVTGYGRPEDVERARRAGFHRHLTKPVDPNVLLAEINAAASRSGGSG
jgi:PAS domain S-box-containing protein